MRRTSHQPDISERMLRCQFLYETLIRILPTNWPMQKKTEYRLLSKFKATIELEFMSKYTWQLHFRLFDGDDSAPEVDLELQMYLDVQLAETVAIFSEPIQVGPAKYPNKQGRYPDEKNQMDNLLLDWLLHIEKTLDEQNKELLS